VAVSPALPPPWQTCEAVLSEAFHLLGPRGQPALSELLRRKAVVPVFDLAREVDRVLAFMRKYVDIPMSLADACLVRMSETLSDPVILTTDTDFRVYRRHGRHVVPCMTPP
jgi:predicted nucleic acid-binding protein